MHQALLLLSSAVVIISYLVYIKEIIKRQVGPHRTTRFVILIIAVLASLSLFAQGSQTAFWLLSVSSVFCLVIFLLSISYGMGGWSKLDILCLFIALAGIVLWRISDNPVVALYSSITADFISFVPTLIKTFRIPESESWFFFLTGVLASGLNLLATREWTIQEISYPVYLLFIDSTIVFLVLRKKIYRRLFMSG